jgi:8-oxo-dGTP pyrophosphatase MutT (NUDIX family)
MQALRETQYTDRLQARIEARLARFEVMHGEDARGLKRAAVAIVILPLEQTFTDSQPTQAAFLLTARAERLNAHARQLALPGGRVDAGETLEETALRELKEELGIAVAPGTIIGRLDDYPTRSGYLISPFVVWAPPGTVAVPNEAEVRSVFRIPLAELRRPDAPEIFSIPESDRPVVRLRLPTLNGAVNAPTAAVLYQFREVALEDRSTRVEHFDQPAWAWR